MKNIFIPILGSVLVTILPASAMASEANWSGPYVGINMGGNVAHNGDATTVGTTGFQTLVPTLAPAVLKTSESTFAGGGQIGYNIQSDSIIYGLEADMNYLGMNKSDSFSSTATVLGTTLTTSAKHQVDYLGTVRARLGFAASDEMLLYVTGGLAYGKVKNSASVVANAAPASLYWSGSASSTRTGFAVGAGAEYALSNRISMRAEYLYYDLGSNTTTAAGSPGVRGISALNGIDYSQRTATKGSLVRVGVNFKL